MTQVLIAEDNLTLLENITFELEMQGYEVVQATNGKDAIDILQQSQSLPDVIVSDIAMPDMDGYKFLEEVRRIEKWQAIPFIFLTAVDSRNAVRIGKGLGADDYLIKPFDPEDLVVAIENKLKRVKQMQSQAERDLDKTRRDLLNLISHELRTPLTAIYGSTEMLEMALADIPDEMTQGLLTLLRSGAKRMNRLVNRVVLMAQIESGQINRMLSQTSKVFDINQIIQDVAGRFDEDTPQPDVQIEMELSESPLPVRGKEDYLKLLVDELVDNAVKFSSRGGTVRITTSTENGNVRVVVRDEGRGIPKDRLNDIWQRFTQVDREIHEQQGPGIGLSLVRDIVKLHEGTCEIDSEVGEGTTAVLILPLAEED